MQKIRAAVLRRRGGPLKIETLEMEGPREDEVLVRIVASGICHTDISYVDEWYDASEGPLVLGHEGAGIVEQVGKKVKRVRRGDHVVLSYQSCGRCRRCRSGRPADCLYLYDLNFGFRRPDGSNALHRSRVRGHFFGQSSFASHSLATERNLVKVPKNLPLEILAPLGCGLQTGAGTVMNSLAVRAGESLAVFGTGAVGLAAVMAARIAGAGPIVGVDVVPSRLELAMELGATHVIDNRREDTAGRVRKIAGGGVDYTVETTGDFELYRLAVDLLKPGGKAAYLTGVSGPGSLPQGRKALSIIQGDAVPQTFIPRLIASYRKGHFPFDRLEKFYDFRQINRAIADARRGRTIKPVLKISRS
ncbi:MAG TPA: NAD(P)-dependent alcohol dehydrogenase [Syntrophales bacterium]|nr:NAD(P)-dependent alcohol dehydrogenase [Syntrophales bacterium]HOX94371.1 NAD(P)-dependent alcohol dehydrogenase [Syntrophales bacterium]HPI57445.1 NAD(P)-dependent alcohol dehydrogenase [Syntrophales bacterium]HPN25698.1 NAD(P)-dependent alcohol dehydrogenase [Syntrophales bacterium]HQM29470.1 NAD(P)-dependent alcohol dehydrogenase [Syntrophales bacterium]